MSAEVQLLSWELGCGVVAWICTCWCSCSTAVEQPCTSMSGVHCATRGREAFAGGDGETG